MEVIARLRNLRISARKVRLVVDMIRGKSVQEAQSILIFAIKRGSMPVLKLLKQAMANAKNNFQLDPDNLFVAKTMVDDGAKYNRWRARARGQGYKIQKKTCHITIILKELEKSKKTKKAKEEIAGQVAEKEETKEKAFEKRTYNIPNLEVAKINKQSETKTAALDKTNFRFKGNDATCVTGKRACEFNVIFCLFF